MRPLRVRAPIYARPADVYSVLTDYDNYKHWNPWLRVMQGEAVTGGYLILRPCSWLFFLPIKYQYHKVERPALLQRTQIGWTRYFFSANRERAIYTKSDGSSLYTTSLTFDGPLGPLMQFLLGRIIYRGVKRETLALKNFCEVHFNIGAPESVKPPALRGKEKDSKSTTINVHSLELAHTL